MRESHQVFSFTCLNCGKTFERKVYFKIKKLVKFCPHCKKNSWKLKHPNYQFYWKMKYQKPKWFYTLPDKLKGLVEEFVKEKAPEA